MVQKWLLKTNEKRIIHLYIYVISIDAKKEFEK